MSGLHLGGNEESETFELQTAREWSDDDELGGPDDDEGQASSSSIWGTPRQNSFEQTFSYIAIAEAEAAGASRQHRERRRTGPRGCRSPLIRVDTLELLLDSPDVDWDPQAFLSQEEETSQERVELRTPSPAGWGGEEQTETQGRDAEVQREGTLNQNVQPGSLIQQNPSLTVQGKKQDSRLWSVRYTVINLLCIFSFRLFSVRLPAAHFSGYLQTFISSQHYKHNI